MKRYHTGVKQLLKNKANGPHRDAIWAGNKPHAKIIVQLGNIHFVFRIGRSAMVPVFVLQFVQETYKEKQQDVHMVSADRLSLHRYFIRITMWITAIPEWCDNVQKRYNANTGSVLDRPLLCCQLYRVVASS